MHKPVVIGPTTDAAEPALEEFELTIPALVGQIFKQEDPGDLFFEPRAGEALIRDLNQKIEFVLPENCFPAAPYRSA